MSNFAINDLVTVAQVRRDMATGCLIDFLFEPSMISDGWCVTVSYANGNVHKSLSATNSPGVRDFKTLDAAVRQVQTICGMSYRPSLLFEAPLSREASDSGFEAREAAR